jgi:multiple sugar transport system substrate-binding protein
VIRLAPFVWSSGGELFDDPDDPTRFTLDTAPAIRAVQRFIELYSPRGVTPSDAEIESEDVVARFMNGRLAMLLSSRRVVPELRTIESFEWDVAPIPAEQEPANVLHSDAFCMTAASEHPDAAWKFVEFALGADGQTVLAATGRTVPSLRSVAESDAFLDPSEPPFRSDVFIDAIPVLRRLPSIEAWPEIEDIADALIEEAMFDPVGPPEAAELITALQTETAAAFARGRP